MASHRRRIAKLEERTDEQGLLVIVRHDGETDDAAWQRYLARTAWGQVTPRQRSRVVFISETDALA